MAQEALLVSQVLVAAALWLLAAYLLYVNFQGRIHRIFALFLFVRGATILINQLARLPGADVEFWAGIRGYFLIAHLPILIDFFLVYQWRTAAAKRRLWRSVNLCIALLAELSYLLDHSVLDKLQDGRLVLGPLGFLNTAYVAALALLALWFALAAKGAAQTGQNKFHALLSLGFMSAAFVEGSLVWVTILRQGPAVLWSTTPPPMGELLAQGLYLLAVPLAAAAMVILLKDARERKLRSPRARWITAVAVVSLLVPMSARMFDASANGLLFLFFLGVTRLIFPGIVGYAIARTSDVDPFLFDLRVRTMLSRGTLGGIFLAVYLAFSDIAGEIIPETSLLQNLDPFWAQVIGAACAGLLLLVLHPLRRTSEKLGSSMLPNAKPVASMSDSDRASIYADQAAIAWRDGSLTRKERELLDRLRDRLGLSPEVASGIESAAARAS